MNERKPQVSVIMPAYNAQNYIKEAIESVLNQTMGDLELLVLDDGSKDNTVAIAKELERKDARVRVLINEKNMGVARTRNRGIDMSKGEYIAFLDSDDVWRKEKLEKQIALAQTTGADIIYSSYALVSENGKRKYNDFIVPATTSFKEMLRCNVLGCSTVLLSKKAKENHRFSTEYYHEDYVLWLALMQDGFKAAGVTECLVDYRVMEVSRSSNKIDSAKKRWIIYRDFLKLSYAKCIYYSFLYAVTGLLKFKKSE